MFFLLFDKYFFKLEYLQKYEIALLSIKLITKKCFRDVCVVTNSFIISFEILYFLNLNVIVKTIKTISILIHVEFLKKYYLECNNKQNNLKLINGKFCLLIF